MSRPPVAVAANAGPVAAQARRGPPARLNRARSRCSWRPEGDSLQAVEASTSLQRRPSLIARYGRPPESRLATLPWRDIPVVDHTRDRGHHHVEIRRLQVTVAGLDFPHATRVLPLLGITSP
jgi:hypothetical protein